MASTPSTVPLGSCIAGIPVTLHYTFFLLLAVEFANAILNSSDYPMYILFVLIMYGPVLLFTIVVHEFGHALMTKRLGGSVGGIVLWPLGGFALCGPTESLGGDLKVSLAGPLTHVPMGLIWWGIYVAVKGENFGIWPSWKTYGDVLSSSAAGFFQILSADAFYLNIALLCFNLFLPAYPLDGGRVYAASLILIFKLRALTAAKVTAATAMLISSGMLIYAIIGVLERNGNRVFLLGLVAVYVFYESYELWTAAKRDELSNHPIFGRQCYQSGGGNSSSSEGQREQEDAVPAQSDDAAMA